MLETKGLPCQSTAFHSLVWNTASYFSQRKQVSICKNLFTDFWVTWLFPGSSSPCFPWEKSQTKPFFYVDVVWNTALNMPGQPAQFLFLSTTSQPRCWRNPHQQDTMGSIHNAKELPNPAQEPLLKSSTGTFSLEEHLSSLTSVA